MSTDFQNHVAGVNTEDGGVGQHGVVLAPAHLGLGTVDQRRWQEISNYTPRCYSSAHLARKCARSAHGCPLVGPLWSAQGHRLAAQWDNTRPRLTPSPARRTSHTLVSLESSTTTFGVQYRCQMISLRLLWRSTSQLLNTRHSHSSIQWNCRASER